MIKHVISIQIIVRLITVDSSEAHPVYDSAERISCQEEGSG